MYHDVGTLSIPRDRHCVPSWPLGIRGMSYYRRSCGAMRNETDTGMRERATVGPFGRDGLWLRCSLHAHTTESDGMLPPAMLPRYYAMGGFDVLAITDHDLLT